MNHIYSVDDLRPGMLYWLVDKASQEVTISECTLIAGMKMVNQNMWASHAMYKWDIFGPIKPPTAAFLYKLK